VLFLDAIYVKIRDGQVANRPIYVALGVTAGGERRGHRQIGTLIIIIITTTTTAIESLKARFGRSVEARGHFPTGQAALKHLYLVILSLDPTGQGRKRWSNRWKGAFNAFDITFEGRLSAGRK
jgi:transposase-like protein